MKVKSIDMHVLSRMDNPQISMDHAWIIHRDSKNPITFFLGGGDMSFVPKSTPISLPACRMSCEGAQVSREAREGGKRKGGHVHVSTVMSFAIHLNAMGDHGDPST